MFMLDDGCCAFATHTCDVILYIYWAHIYLPVMCNYM